MAKETLPVPSGQAKHRPKAEGRVWVRFPPSQQVCHQPIAASKADETETHWLGRLRNVSPGGLALRLSRHFEPGILLIIDLEVQGGTRSFFVQVIHATPEGKRHWIVGCEFISPLSQEELHALIAG